VPNVLQGGSIRWIAKQIDDAVRIQQRILVPRSRVNEESADLILVINAAGSQMARRVPSGVRDVVAQPERGVAAVAHCVILVADVGEMDLEIRLTILFHSGFVNILGIY
jgi:hypothetical protein